MTIWKHKLCGYCRVRGISGSVSSFASQTTANFYNSLAILFPLTHDSPFDEYSSPRGFCFLDPDSRISLSIRTPHTIVDRQPGTRVALLRQRSAAWRLWWRGVHHTAWPWALICSLIGRPERRGGQGHPFIDCNDVSRQNVYKAQADCCVGEGSTMPPLLNNSSVVQRGEGGRGELRCQIIYPPI